MIEPICHNKYGVVNDQDVLDCADDMCSLARELGKKLEAKGVGQLELSSIENYLQGSVGGQFSFFRLKSGVFQGRMEREAAKAGDYQI